MFELILDRAMTRAQHLRREKRQRRQQRAAKRGPGPDRRPSEQIIRPCHRAHGEDGEARGAHADDGEEHVIDRHEMEVRRHGEEGFLAAENAHHQRARQRRDGDGGERARRIVSEHEFEAVEGAPPAAR